MLHFTAVDVTQLLPVALTAVDNVSAAITLLLTLVRCCEAVTHSAHSSTKFVLLQEEADIHAIITWAKVSSRRRAGDSDRSPTDEVVG